MKVIITRVTNKDIGGEKCNTVSRSQRLPTAFQGKPSYRQEFSSILSPIIYPLGYELQ